MRPYLLLFALATLPYTPGLFHEFVYDDHGVLVENRFWNEPNALKRVLTFDTFRDPRVLDGQRPTFLLSILLDRALGAREPWSFRLTNLALHAACAMLLYAWLAGMLHRAGDPAARARACNAGILFALHPLASEAVQVPSYREDLLALFWMLAALAPAPAQRPALRIPLQLFCAALALGAKESAAALPFLLALVRWCFPSERPGPRIDSAQDSGKNAASSIQEDMSGSGEKRARLRGIFRWAWLDVALIFVLVVVWFAFAFAARPAQALRAEWNGLALRPPENVWTAPLLFLQHLKLLAAPWPLCADRVVEPVAAPASIAFLLPVALVVAWAAVGFLTRARAPLVAVGIGWIMIAFAPVSNLIPLFNPFADRYAYAMIAGLAILAAALPPADRVVRRGLIAIALTYLVLLQLRLPDWRNDEYLWNATLRVEPRSARAHAGLGLAALARGDTESAVDFFARADRLNPQDVSALINLAIIEGRRGDHAAAAARLEEAGRRRPDKPEAWANLAVAYELLGRREEALDAAARARSLDPLGRY